MRRRNTKRRVRRGKYSFNNVPMIQHSRSRFKMSYSHFTSANVGDLFPHMIQEVYSGDTFDVKVNSLARVSSSFIRVPMSNFYLDTFYFFVPSRLLWKHWEEMFGENKDGYWVQEKEFEVPQCEVDVGSPPAGISTQCRLSDYLGIPTFKNNDSAEGFKISQLPFRAFAKIHNDWFLNENIQRPALFDLPDNDVPKLNYLPYAPDNIFGLVPKVSKYHDYFTSGLPNAQKGKAVDLPLAVLNGQIPVDLGEKHSVSSSVKGLSLQGAGVPAGSGRLLYAFHPSGDTQTYLKNGSTNESAGPDSPGELYLRPDNLWANIEGNVELSPISVNDLRYAFQLQKMLERDARAGTRYTEYLQAHFGVVNPDARLQRSEYLGGSHTPISIGQVAQTSPTQGFSPLAGLAGLSQTFGRDGFYKGFTEHGFIIGIACVRQKHVYAQGIEKFWKRKQRLDFYDPVFANIGEQPIYKYQLCASHGTLEDLNAPFAYQEAWADLRHNQDRVSAGLRSEHNFSLDMWLAQDFYQSAPSLTEEFLLENSDNFDRVVSVPSASMSNFIFDFFFDITATRVMPTYSIPQLIDHN